MQCSFSHNLEEFNVGGKSFELGAFEAVLFSSCLPSCVWKDRKFSFCVIHEFIFKMVSFHHEMNETTRTYLLWPFQKSFPFRKSKSHICLLIISALISWLHGICFSFSPSRLLMKNELLRIPHVHFAIL